jgi:hypothetical protein
VSRLRQLLALPGLLLLMSGCGGGGHGANGCVASFSATERTQFRHWLGRRLEDAARLKQQDVGANRLILASLPVFPGSSKLREGSRPFDSGGPVKTDRAARADEYARCVLFPRAYLEVQATGWTSERDYVLPPSIKAKVVRDFFVSHLRPRWRVTHEARYPGAPQLRRHGIGAYDLRFSGRRCLGILIGVTETGVSDKRRGIQVDVHKRTATPC